MTRLSGWTGWSALALLLAAAPVGAQSPDALPPAREVFDRFVQAIGGREAVLRQTSSRATARAVMSDGTAIESEYLNVAPNLSLVRMRSGGDEFVTGYDGSMGWTVEMGQPRLITGSELADLAEESIFHRILHDDSLFRSAQTVERREVEGRPCWYVRMVWKSGRETGACFDVESGLRVLSEYSLRSPETGRVPVTELHGEYRDYGGVRTPSVIRFRTMGVETVITFTSVAYNVVNAAELAPPESIRALAGQPRPAGP
jgi:hypothetical protein